MKFVASVGHRKNYSSQSSLGFGSPIITLLASNQVGIFRHKFLFQMDEKIELSKDFKKLIRDEVQLAINERIAEKKKKRGPIEYQKPTEKAKASEYQILAPEKSFAASRYQRYPEKTFIVSEYQKTPRTSTAFEYQRIPETSRPTEYMRASGKSKERDYEWVLEKPRPAEYPRTSGKPKPTDECEWVPEKARPSEYQRTYHNPRPTEYQRTPVKSKPTEDQRTCEKSGPTEYEVVPGKSRPSIYQRTFEKSKPTEYKGTYDNSRPTEYQRTSEKYRPTEASEKGRPTEYKNASEKYKPNKDECVPEMSRPTESQRTSDKPRPTEYQKTYSEYRPTEYQKTYEMCRPNEYEWVPERSRPSESQRSSEKSRLSENQKTSEKDEPTEYQSTSEEYKPAEHKWVPEILRPYKSLKKTEQCGATIYILGSTPQMPRGEARPRSLRREMKKYPKKETPRIAAEEAPSAGDQKDNRTRSSTAERFRKMVEKSMTKPLKLLNVSDIETSCADEYSAVSRYRRNLEEKERKILEEKNSLYGAPITVRPSQKFEQNRNYQMLEELDSYTVQLSDRGLVVESYSHWESVSPPDFEAPYIPAGRAAVFVPLQPCSVISRVSIN